MFLEEKHRGNNKPAIAHHKVPLQIQIVQLSKSAKFRGNTTEANLDCGEGDASKTTFLGKRAESPSNQMASGNLKKGGDLKVKGLHSCGFLFE